MNALDNGTNNAHHIHHRNKKNWQYNLQMAIPELTKFVNVFPKTTTKVLVIDRDFLVIDRKISITRGLKSNNFFYNLLSVFINNLSEKNEIHVKKLKLKYFSQFSDTCDGCDRYFRKVPYPLYSFFFLSIYILIKYRSQVSQD